MNIGASIPSGRAKGDRRYLFASRKEEIISRINKCAVDYAEKIHIHKIKNSGEMQRHADLKFHCQAGKSIIVVSEEGLIRPCIMIPQYKNNSVTVQEYYYQYVKGDKVPDYSAMLKEMQEDLRRDNYSFFDMECAGFCKV